MNGAQTTAENMCVPLAPGSAVACHSIFSEPNVPPATTDPASVGGQTDRGLAHDHSLEAIGPFRERQAHEGGVTHIARQVCPEPCPDRRFEVQPNPWRTGTDATVAGGLRTRDMGRLASTGALENRHSGAAS